MKRRIFIEGLNNFIDGPFIGVNFPNDERIMHVMQLACEDFIVGWVHEETEAMVTI